jgi:hypothetical protein
MAALPSVKKCNGGWKQPLLAVLFFQRSESFSFVFQAMTTFPPTLRTYTVYFSYRYGVDKQYISNNSTVVDAVDEAAAAYIVRDRNWMRDVEVALVKRHEYAAW